jgi:hypothetical protein
MIPSEYLEGTQQVSQKKRPGDITKTRNIGVCGSFVSKNALWDFTLCKAYLQLH